jgi:hypothetical protein
VDRRFLNAHIDPAPFRLLGRTLYPWCLKYRVRLHAFDSPLGLPWPMSIVANLVANGIDEKRAWEMPECQAIWLNAAFAMRKGVDVAIMSPEEEAYIEEQLKASEGEAPVANPAG